MKLIPFWLGLVCAGLSALEWDCRNVWMASFWAGLGACFLAVWIYGLKATP